MFEFIQAQWKESAAKSNVCCVRRCFLFFNRWGHWHHR